MITFNDIRHNKKILEYIKYSDECLNNMGYTEHNMAHVTFVSSKAAYLLESLGFDEREVELTRIAGFMHDIGNSINRELHSISGGVLSQSILSELGMPLSEVIKISSAIGNHDEGSGLPISHIASALIIADKSDIRRSRVRNLNIDSFDIHSKVNYSVKNSNLKIDVDDKIITLSLILDTEYSTTLDFFEIFLSRMTMCKEAATKLGCEFKLNIIESDDN